ncbi:MAG: type II transport protein GspH [Polaromonas sp.]|nr:type II transport protein GspH [Polaromonas sp.]
MAEKHQNRYIQWPVWERHVKGFTLVELLVTIVIGVLLMVVAVPSFVTFQKNAQLSDAVSNFIAAINVARANAMKQGVDAYLEPKSGTDWRTGWTVYADTNFNQSYDAVTDPVILSFEALATSVSVATTTGSLTSGYVRFNGSGYPRLKNNGFGGGTIVMSNGTRSSSIIIDPAGRVRSCTTGTTGC